MHRRRFFGLVGGAIAAVAGIAGGRPVRAVAFGAGKPYGKLLLISDSRNRIRFQAPCLPGQKYTIYASRAAYDQFMIWDQQNVSVVIKE